jgi:ribosomal protein S18 acetylase RimI-like enzyme
MIRAATQQDQEQIIDLIHTIYQEFGFGWDPSGYHQDLYNLAEHYANPNNFWVYQKQNKIVGCIGIEVFTALPGTKGELTTHQGQTRIAQADCELCRLYLLPSARGQRIGLELAQTCINYAREKRCHTMEIWSDHVLHQAHNLYRKLGATTIGERLCPPPDETPEWGMLIDLSS